MYLLMGISILSCTEKERNKTIPFSGEPRIVNGLEEIGAGDFDLHFGLHHLILLARFERSGDSTFISLSRMDNLADGARWKNPGRPDLTNYDPLAVKSDLQVISTQPEFMVLTWLQEEELLEGRRTRIFYTMSRDGGKKWTPVKNVYGDNKSISHIGLEAEAMNNYEVMLAWYEKDGGKRGKVVTSIIDANDFIKRRAEITRNIHEESRVRLTKTAKGMLLAFLVENEGEVYPAVSQFDGKNWNRRQYDLSPVLEGSDFHIHHRGGKSVLTFFDKERNLNVVYVEGNERCLYLVPGEEIGEVSVAVGFDGNAYVTTGTNNTCKAFKFHPTEGRSLALPILDEPFSRHNMIFDTKSLVMVFENKGQTICRKLRVR